MTLEDALRRPTLSVPVAGSLFYGLSRNGAYQAAKRGDIPTIKIGRKIMVPVALMAKRLGLHHNISEQS
ncbi:DNA-binding protein [Ensifer sp. 22521]|uniref:DNA-binding protein n=1 Tax=Ensifer sp. 22521 TaxID=3453935 RepID=UPI003F83876F